MQPLIARAPWSVLIAASAAGMILCFVRAPNAREPPSPLAIQAVDVRAEPQEFTGRCSAPGQRIVFSAQIRGMGFGAVHYQWERSDSARRREEIVEIQPGEPSHVATEWLLPPRGARQDGWMRLRILSPMTSVSDLAYFTINCSGSAKRAGHESVQGVVRDEGGVFIKGALVTVCPDPETKFIGSSGAHTDDQGRYRLSGLSSGSRTLVVQRSTDIIGTAEEISIRPGRETEKNFTLVGGMLAGQVDVGAKSDLPLRVELFRLGRSCPLTEATVTPKADGRFLVMLPPGTYGMAAYQGTEEPARWVPKARAEVKMRQEASVRVPLWAPAASSPSP